MSGAPLCGSGSCGALDRSKIETGASRSTTAHCVSAVQRDDSTQLYATQDDGAKGPVFPLGSAPEAHLFLVLECSRPLAGGASYALAGIDEVVLGRGPSRCASRETRDGVRRLVVEVPDPFMSARHAVLKRSGDGFVLEDARSRNGSTVNGAIVASATLTDADTFELGRTIFQAGYVNTPQQVHLDVDASCGPSRPKGLMTLLPALADTMNRVSLVAQSGVPMILSGETGTGKEVLARAIHALSGRAGGYVPVNCAALPEALVESQLFGHVKGAFTGAVSAEPGLLRTASGGTLFLDEIGELPLEAQAKLLRALQEHEVVPVGATRPTKLDLRVIAATNKSLRKLVEAGQFRSDLFARLAGLSVRLPPLRERRQDIGIIAASALTDIAGSRAGDLSFEREAGIGLVHHVWPFNARELFRALSLAYVLRQGGMLTWKHLSEALGPSRDGEPSSSARNPDPGKALRRSVVAALDAHNGNVSKAAKALGKSRPQVHRWIRRFDLDVHKFRGR